MIKWNAWRSSGDILSRVRASRAAFRLDASSWNFYSIMGIVALTVALIPTWPRLPLFMDAYYHLSVMRGFADAGGWVGWAFWEYAPAGRAHLYPPLFHLFELALFRLGMAPMGIGRCCDFLIYPLFLFSMWNLARGVAGARLAFFFLVLLSTSYSLYLAIVTNIPFSLAMAMGAWATYFLVTGRRLAGTLFLAAMFYTHTLMSLLAAAAFFAAAWRNGGPLRRSALAMLGTALLLALPLFFHQVRYLSYATWHRVMENSYIDINLIFYALAATGLVLFVRGRCRERGAFYFGWLLVALAPLLVTHPDRFFSGCGLVPLLFFGAAAVEAGWDRLSARWGRPVAAGFFLCLWGLLYAAAPIVSFSPLTKRPAFQTGSFLAYVTQWDRIPAGKGVTIYYPKLVWATVELLARSSRPGDIVFSNFDYAGGMVAMLAHRPTSFAMMQEVRPERSFDPIASARWILWFKDAPSSGGNGRLLLEAIAQRYNFRPVGESGLAYLYAGQGPGAAMRPARAVVPQGACFFLLGLGALGVCWDAWIRGQLKRKSGQKPADSSSAPSAHP